MPQMLNDQEPFGMLALQRCPRRLLVLHHAQQTSNGNSNRNHSRDQEALLAQVIHNNLYGIWRGLKLALHFISSTGIKA